MDVSIIQEGNGHLPNVHSHTGTSQTYGNSFLGKNQSNYVMVNIPKGHIVNDIELQDLEDGTLETISQKVSNGVVHTIANGVRKLTNGHTMAPAIANGIVANKHALTYSEHI